MGKPLLLATVLIGLGGCATAAIDPVLNPAPQGRLLISGHRDADVEVHFRILYMSEQEECLIERPFLGGRVVRIHDDELSIPPGSEEFSAEFFLDKYLPGQCQWRTQQIRVSVNRPPYHSFTAAWHPLVWVGSLGTPGLEEVRYVCRPPKPTSTSLWCDGPIAAVPELPGQLHVTFVVEDFLDNPPPPES